MDAVNTQEVKAPKKGSLMIVDDEISVLKTLDKLLSSHYDIITAESGEKALELISSGLKPDVIMSDQVMPGITGAELLDKTLAYSPDSVRVILTGNSSPKDIISAINQAHAYMFLTKPWDNVQLIQAIRLCFDHFRLQSQNKFLNLKLNSIQRESDDKDKSQSKQQVQATFDENVFFTNTANGLSQLVLANENWFYTPHTTNVAAIAKEISREAVLGPEFQNNLLIAALLHNITTIGMPTKLLLTDPEDLNEADRIEYFKNFNSRVVALSKIPKFQKVASIISTIWERHDGSGYPLGLSGMQLTKESQILAMSNIYHNKVYRVTLDEYRKDRNRGMFIQQPDTTVERHNEVIKYFYRHASWFDVDLSNHFHSLIKKRAFAPLTPVATTLEIHLDAEGSRNYRAPESNLQQVRKIIEAEQDDKSSNEPRFVEKEILVEQLQAGMVVGQNILTKTGILIVRQETTLDASHVRNIKSASINGMFGKSLQILTQVE